MQISESVGPKGYGLIAGQYLSTLISPDVHVGAAVAIHSDVPVRAHESFQLNSRYFERCAISRSWVAEPLTIRVDLMNVVE